MAPTASPRVERLEVSAFKVPTESPEADGTIAWDSTTLVVVELAAGGKSGLGWTYASRASAELVDERLKAVVVGREVMSIPACWEEMVRSVRNVGRPGIASLAVSAVDVALWDLKAKLLGLPLVDLLGAARESVNVYGSGGFTSYDPQKLVAQLGRWVELGIPRVKMKIGTEPKQDLSRVREVRRTLGEGFELFVDANGAYTRKQALQFAERFKDLGVTWFEEPVSSDDLEGLRLLRDRGPGGMDIAAGEYGFDADYFRRMLAAGAVDVLQADATRCGGYTGFLQAAALCTAWHVPLSAHCAPNLHAPVCCASIPVTHLEHFFDHDRIERMLFEGALSPVKGKLTPDRSRPGLGMELKRKDAEKFRL